MSNPYSKTTYQYIADLELEELDKAQSLEEMLAITNHFRTMRDAVYQREFESFYTAA
ncbi:hypothetical protein [Vibrio sp. 99-70-13A1]|uniref:hypothetical protein n=1 Tax=Vibrio TaxID=662 RepID=UPI001493D998|nr:hypothetical protein [Vibrio sp. 99-70-13A1]